MILSASTIRGLLSGARKVIDPVPDKSRLEFIEGNLFDLTLDEVRAVRIRTEEVFIGVDERIIPPADLIEWGFDGRSRSVVHLDMGRSYLLKSAESIKLPPGFQVLVLPRSSFFRGGGIIQCTSTPFGYDGKITVGFSIPPKSQYFTLERGCHFCTLMFLRVDSNLPNDLDPYKGVYGGNKTTTEGQVERGF